MNNRTVCKVMNPTDVATCQILKRKTPLRVIHKLYLDNVTVDDNDITNSQEVRMTENEDSVPVKEQLEAIAEKGVTLQQNSLAAHEFEKLIKLIYRNRDLCATSMHDLVGTDVEMMHIDTGDAKTVRKRAYRQSAKMQRVMQKQIDEMLAAKII